MEGKPGTRMQVRSQPSWLVMICCRRVKALLFLLDRKAASMMEGAVQCIGQWFIVDVIVVDVIIIDDNHNNYDNLPSNIPQMLGCIVRLRYGHVWYS